MGSSRRAVARPRACPHRQQQEQHACTELGEAETAGAAQHPMPRQRAAAAALAALASAAAVLGPWGAAAPLSAQAVSGGGGTSQSLSFQDLSGQVGAP